MTTRAFKKHVLDRPMSKPNQRMLTHWLKTLSGWKRIRAIYYDGTHLYAATHSDTHFGDWFERFPGKGGSATPYRVYHPHDGRRRPALVEIIEALTDPKIDAWVGDAYRQTWAPGAVYRTDLYDLDGKPTTSYGRRRTVRVKEVLAL